MNEDAKWLYDQLTSLGYGLGTQEEYAKTLSNEEDLKWYYETATSNGLGVGSYDEFKNGFGKSTVKSDDEIKREALQGARDAIKKLKNGNTKRNSYQDMLNSDTSYAESHMTKKKEEEQKKQEAESEYKSIGLTDSDMLTASNLQIEEANERFANLNHLSVTNTTVPQINEFGLIELHDKSELEQKKEKELNDPLLQNIRANVPAYLTRGEDTEEDIQMNAIERAQNTVGGSEMWDTAVNAAIDEYRNSDEYKALLEKYYAGEVTEEEINKDFSDKYMGTIMNDYWKEISKEGGLMRNYIDIALEKSSKRNASISTNTLDVKLDEEINNAINKSLENKGELFAKQLTTPALMNLRNPNHIDESLVSAKEFNDESNELIKAVKEGKGFFKGVGDTAKDLDTWDLGVGELSRNKELLRVVNKLEANEELTHNEELLMDAALNYFAASAYYSKGLGRGYKAGQTSMASVPFMIQFVTSSGMMSTINAATKTGVKGVNKLIIKQLLKYGKKKLAVTATNTASGLVGSVLNATILTSTFGAAHVASGTAQRMTGQVIPEWNKENQDWDYAGREYAQGAGEAFRNSYIENFVENFSEMALANTLSPIGAYMEGTGLFRYISKNNVVGSIMDIRNNPAFKSFRQKTQFNGYFGEVAEEYFGGLLRRAAMTDVNNWQEAGLDIDGQIDIFLGLAPTSLLFGGYGTVNHYTRTAIDKKRMRNSLTSEEEKQLFDKLMSESRSGQFGDIAHDFLRNVISNPNMTDEDKREAFIGVAFQYRDLLSKELQDKVANIETKEVESQVDSKLDEIVHSDDNRIYETKDAFGRTLYIKEGKVATVEYNGVTVIDTENSAPSLLVGYLSEDGTRTYFEFIDTEELTMPVFSESVENIKQFASARYKAEQGGEDTFEVNGYVYNVDNGSVVGTAEEYKEKQEIQQTKDELSSTPKVNTRARHFSGTFNIEIDGKQHTVKLTSMIGSPMTQNEDGSIRAGEFSVTVDGLVVRGQERKDIYINAVSEQMKADHAKAVAKYNASAEAVPVEQEELITPEDRAKRERELEVKTVMQSMPRDKKTGEIDMDKLTPEQTVVAYMQEETPEGVISLMGEQLQYINAKIEEISSSKTMPPIEKRNKSRKYISEVKGYEEAIAKWLGEEALAQIKATPVMPAQPMQEPVVMPEAVAVEAPAAPATMPAVEPVVEQAPVVEPEVVVQEQEVEPAPVPVEETEQEPVSIDLNKVAIYKRNILGNNSDMYRFVEKGEEGEEDGVEDLFQTTPQGAKKTRSEKFVKQTPEFGFINSDTPCIILNRVYKDGYANVLTEHGLQKVNLKQVTSTKKANNVFSEQEENNQKYQTFDELMGFDLIHVGGKGGLVITLKDVIDIERTKKPFNAIEEKIKLALEKYSAKNADIKAITTDNIQEFTRRFNEATRLWNKLIEANNLEVSPVNGRMGKDSKHNPINELRQSFTEVARENAIRIEAGETPLLSDELLESFNSFDATSAFVSKDVKEMDYQQMINYLLEIYQAKDNLDIDNNEFKVLVDEVLSHLAHKPSAAQMKKGNQKDHMRMPRINFMKEIGMKAQEEGGVYKDILKEALRKQNLKEAAKYQVDQTLVEELSTDEQTEVNETPEKPKKTSKSKGRKKKADGTIDLNNLSDSIIALSIKANDMSRIRTEREVAKITIDKYLEELSEDNVLALYDIMIKERDASQGIMVDDVNKAMEAVEASKNGSIITRKREEAFALINARLAEEAAQQQAQEQAEEVINNEEETTTEEPVSEEPVAEEPAKKSADVLKKEIEELNERLNNLSVEEEEEFDAILAQIQEKNQQLEEMGKGYREKKSSKPREKYSGMADSAAGATNYDMDEGFSAAHELMVGEVVAEHAESTKRIIKILKAAGVRVITFKNEDLPKYISKKKLQELSDGQIVYGFTSNDTIYLNEDHFNPNAPLHEFTHLWVTAYKQAFPEEWERFVEIANKSALAANLRKPLKDGKENPYAKLNADEMASEVLSRYTGYLYGKLDAKGRTAFEDMMQAQTTEEKIAEKSLLNRIRNIWKKIISWFDKSIENEKKDSIDDMIRQFAQRPMETLARGREAVDELKQIAKQGYKVQSVYHGTTAEFGQFDHDFMGSGEGAQAYGWGTYVSQVKDIAVSYAKDDARRKRFIPQYKSFGSRDIDDIISNYLYIKRGKDNDSYSIHEYRNDLMGQLESIVRSIKSIMRDKSLLTPELELASAEEFVHKIYNFPSRERKEIINGFVAAGVKLREINEVDRLDDTQIKEIESIIVAPTCHLYEVQIPAESYLEDGSIDLENSPYLGWDDDYAYNSRIHRMLVQHLSEEVDKLAKELSETPNPEFPALTLKEYVANGDWFYEEDMSYFSQELKDKLNNYFTSARTLRILSNHSEESGAGIYRIVKEMTGSPKAASEWLLSNGIVGVRVSTGATSGKKRDTKNYVIFNEADAHIVNHTAFMIGEDGKLMLSNTSENLDNSNNFSTFAQNNEKGEQEYDLRRRNRDVLHERFRDEELQGSNGAIEEAEASLQRGSNRSNPENTSSKFADKELAKRQEAELESWARDRGMWIDNTTEFLAENYGEPIDTEGGESVVYLSPDGTKVIKENSIIYYGEPQLALDRMVLHNYFELSAAAPLTLTHFGRNEYGDFVMIMEQPYIQGEKVTQQEIVDAMKALGYELYAKKSDGTLRQTEFVNKEQGIVINDLHDENVMKLSNGEYVVIDGDFRLNTSNLGIGGTRTTGPTEDAEFMIGPAESGNDPVIIQSELARNMQIKIGAYLGTVANSRARIPQEFNEIHKGIAQLLDRTEGIRLVMDKIAKYRRENGMPPMGEGYDVRTMVEAMDSKIDNETRLYVETKENKLRTCIYKLAKRVKKSTVYATYRIERGLKENGKKSELTPREMIERYLITQDSYERNELNGNARGEEEFIERMGVDMETFRQQFLEEIASTEEDKKEIEQLWEAIRGVTGVVITEGERSGLISAEDAEVYRKRKYYVPERDFAEVEANEDLQVEDDGSHGRMGNKLMAIQKAKGGKSLAANVLGNMCLLARDAIVKANKNIVKKSMYDLLRANEDWCRDNKVPIPQRVWYVKDEKGKVKKQTEAPSKADQNTMRDLKAEIRKREDEIILNMQLAKGAKNEAVRDAYLADVEEIEREIDGLRESFPYLDEFDTRDMMFLSRATQKESTVTVFIDGVPCEMHFPNMTIVANALNCKFDKRGQAEWLKKLTSGLSASMTVYNPLFFSVNVVRDVPFIMTKGFAEYGWKFPFRFTWQLAQKLFTLDVWKVIWTGDYTKAKNPHIREFFEGGGNTGYSTIPDINKLKKAAKGWDKKTTISWQDIGDVVSYLNTFSEVWTRLAAYSTVRSLNGTKEDGIRAAKNLSVNFNRRGLGNPIMNTFNSISFFANAAIQGASGFYRSFHTNKPNKVNKFAQGFRATAGFMFTPAMVGYLATLLTPDDDEGLMWYSDYERDNYVLFGEKRIPLNEQLKPFWVVGVNMALVSQGRRTMEQALNSVMSAFFTNLVPAAPNINSSLVMATNAIIGTRDYTAAMIVENMIVPQSMSNISDLSHNVSFMGSKLRYDMGDMPEYLQGENEALMYREIARLFYEWGGGDTNLPSKHREVLNDDGTISYEKIKFGDRNPREIEAFMSIGIPSTFRDFGNLVTGVVKGDFGEATDYTSIKRFYNPREKEMTMYQIIREAKDLVKDYEDQMSNYKKHLAGAGLSNNQDKQDKAEARIKNIIGNGEIINIKELVDGYEALSIYTYAKQFGMTEKQFIQELEINKPASAKAFKKMNGVPREEIVRKVLTLMRQYKGIDVKNSNLKEE